MDAWRSGMIRFRGEGFEECNCPRWPTVSRALVASGLRVAGGVSRLVFTPVSLTFCLFCFPSFLRNTYFVLAAGADSPLRWIIHYPVWAHKSVSSTQFRVRGWGTRRFAWLFALRCRGEWSGGRGEWRG